MKRSSTTILTRLSAVLAACLISACAYVKPAPVSMSPDNGPDSLAARVEENLVKAGVSSATGIVVQEEPNGVVALHGLVNTSDQVRQAEMIARATPGVTMVRNIIGSMDVSPGGSVR